MTEEDCAKRDIRNRIYIVQERPPDKPWHMVGWFCTRTNAISYISERLKFRKPLECSESSAFKILELERNFHE